MNINPSKPLLIAALLCLPLASHAEDAGYWSVQGGVNKLSDWPGTVNFGGPAADASLQLDRGAQFGAAIGRQYDKTRYELEYQHGQFDITGARVAALTQPADGSGKYDVLTANAYRTLPLNDTLALYAGLGLGYGRINLPKVGGATGCQCLGKASKGSAAYQARLGMEYRTSDTGLAFVQAGWLSLPGARSEGTAYVTYPRRGFATVGVGYRGLLK